jgi:hypothetical protein
MSSQPGSNRKYPGRKNHARIRHGAAIASRKTRGEAAMAAARRLAPATPASRKSRRTAEKPACNFATQPRYAPALPLDRRRTASISRALPPLTSPALPLFSAANPFRLSDQPFDAAADSHAASHGLSANFRLSGVLQASGLGLSVIACSHLNKGGTAVDLALRLNVLAVCAVFLFVGAVLLGAF